VDQSGSLHFGPYTKAGLAVEVAAVLALAAARQRRVGALLFADAPEYVVRPAKAPARALARHPRPRRLAAPRPGQQTGGALSYAGSWLRHRAIIVVLSTSGLPTGRPLNRHL